MKWPERSDSAIRVVTFARLVNGGGELLPEGLPPDAKEGLIVVTLVVNNLRSGSFHVEEWALRPLRNGNFLVAAMRIPSVGAR